ncbi:MAG: Asp-tRNA(Asn)/Glu-tRNA(Gln) amidotransferase subunit GatB [Deltaproteobacteria bacterium]|nr:Asp-tRNA(Asn)/Glu-tRNA(Gln) amidotransferase subunit GatB [Deltaproteobacteria bacterium]
MSVINNEDVEKVLKKFEPVMGLEVHAQLKTTTKLMSAASNQFGSSPNTAVSTICTGMPGALPVLNKKAVQMALQAGLALDCEIQKRSVFSRKHYFYPDLPKGYQISQYDRPYALKGAVQFYLNGEKRKIALTRIHLEEDAGKNLHFDDRGVSLVDLNRSSVPLIEIVSEPEIRSTAEAAAYLKALRLALRYLDICEGNLEEGNFRCDANISLRPRGEQKFGTRVELKNINSFRNLERAITYEILRQADLLDSGGKITQETRLWDADQNKSISMRSKEEAADYRYMPEPDLLPLEIVERDIEDIRKKLPEMPIARMDRFIRDYGRNIYDADVLTASSSLADYYETVSKAIQDPQLASTFIQTNVLAHIANVETDIETFFPDAKALSDLLLKMKDKTLSLNLAKEVFEIMMAEKKPAAQIISEKGMAQVSDDSALLAVIEKVIAENPGQLAELKAGKDKLFGFFMGQCQKALGGKGNPATLKELLEKKLKG